MNNNVWMLPGWKSDKSDAAWWNCNSQCCTIATYFLHKGQQR